MTTKEIMEQSVRFLDSKKAEDICALDIHKVTSLGDYFVIASGTSTTQVRTLADGLEEHFSKQGLEPLRVEGGSSAMWVLIDYGDVIVHVFYSEQRDFYCLERLWADAPKVDISGLLQQS
ncbi:ribosome silencing factor [Oscillospiraceae bacterium MB08-C2-2]|nr:ribosome silencing factor [Oscillospiraceae bacterium MB08-C2-2]